MSVLKHIGIVFFAIVLTWSVWQFMVAASMGIVGPIGRFLRRTLSIKRDYVVIATSLVLVSMFLPIAIGIATFVTLTSTRYFVTDGQLGVAIIQYGLVAWLIATLLAYTLGDLKSRGERARSGVLEHRMIQHVKEDEGGRHPLFQMSRHVLSVGHALMHGSKKEGMEANDSSQVETPVWEPLPEDQNARKIGVIVVHGIGEQAPGETVSKIESGLSTALAAEAGLNPIWGKREDVDRCVLVPELQRELRFYEVYWADCLHPTAYGSFDIAMTKELAWFPVINANPRWRRIRAAMHTAVLLIVVGLLSIANAALDIPRMLKFFRLFRSDRNEVKENISGLDPDLNSQKMEDAGFLIKRTWIDRLLDDFAGDIVTYVIAASYYRAREGEVHATHPAARIYQRFDEKLDIALRDCDEVHVLAHSLGTIIAYHMLTQREPNDRITDIYTIGSPLRKCKIFWPWLTTKITAGQRVRWHNFAHMLDLVSNMRLGLNLGRHVNNHLLLEGGAMRSHVIYEWNRRFLRIFTEHTLGREIAGPGGLARACVNLVRGVVETVVLPLTLLAAVALGLASIIIGVLSGMLFYWLMAKAATAAGWPALGTWMHSALVWLVIVTVVLGILRIAFTPKSLAARSLKALRNPPSDLLDIRYEQRVITDEDGNN